MTKTKGTTFEEGFEEMCWNEAKEAKEETRLQGAHLALLSQGTGHQDKHEISETPVFTAPVLKNIKDVFRQYGFFAGTTNLPHGPAATPDTFYDPRLFFNITAPSSAFICGSQGSGKSHTLSCLLENCLMKSDVSRLETPLSGLVFHYDSFTSDARGTPCEAAHLSSNSKIKVKVLCSPANKQTIMNTYSDLAVTIEELKIDQSDLNTKRMMDLMAVNPENGPMPLYLHAITRILREMRIEQQSTRGAFDYSKFKRQAEDSEMTPAQKMPLNQRLDTLESFMPKEQTLLTKIGTKKAKFAAKAQRGNDWAIEPGTLTIVDLSCPTITAESACSLFNMCLSLYLEQKTTTGRVIALDEAHKYMAATTEASSLTATLLASIRLQRHLGTRIFISTQEPTISPQLLDLCSITVVHRFTSPEWLRCLKQHLAALDYEEDGEEGKREVKRVFGEIVRLGVGEALLFCPNAGVGIDREFGVDQEEGEIRMQRLGTGYLKVRVRARLTEDGGKSVMAA